MSFSNTQNRPKVQRVINIRFERQSIEVPIDEELVQFVQQIEPNSAKEDDIHVFHAYFQLYWPFKTDYHRVGNKNVMVNKPQEYRGYSIFKAR